MRKLARFSIFITVLSLALLTPLQAQAQTAPDAATSKISELVHAGRYAEAQQLTAGLLIAYPTDQRLIKAKALIEQLMSQPAPAAPQTSSAPPVAGQLTGMDKVDYNALLDLARQAQQSTDLAEQTNLLTQFMQQSDGFVQRHPDQMLLWQLRAASSITLNEPMMGYEAGHKLLALSAADSNDPAMQSLLGKLKNMGWLDRQQAETLQVSADAAREAEQKSAESVKYTFPVVHVHGISYGYGHLTINEDEAIYVGTENENFHIARKDISELKIACNAYACGFYITPKSGRRYFVIAVTEDAVTNRTDKGSIYLKPAVLGNAFIARWHFVAAADNKSLHPPADETPERGKHTGSFMSSGAGPSPTAPAGSLMRSAEPAPAAFLANTPAPAAANAPSATPSSSAVSDVPAPAAPATVPTISASSTATLYVYRKHQIAGMGKKTEVSIDGKMVAKLSSEEVVRIDVAAGKHNLSAVESHIKVEQPLYDFEMEAGKEYWIHSEFTNGLITHLKLTVVPAEQAQAETKSLKEVNAADTVKK